MSERYEIMKINDFLSVPDGRLDTCLLEFAESIRTVKATVAIVRMTAEGAGVTLPDDFYMMEGFVWTDDGTLNQTLDITFKGEQA